MGSQRDGPTGRLGTILLEGPRGVLTAGSSEGPAHSGPGSPRKEGARPLVTRPQDHSARWDAQGGSIY